MQVAELYAGRAGLRPRRSWWRELVEAEAVPVPARAAATSRRACASAAWEETWELQRQEDAIDARTELPRRSEHLAETGRASKRERSATSRCRRSTQSADFQKARYWRLRGKLDVPKERFVSYPALRARRRPDAWSIGWAGWDHLAAGPGPRRLLPGDEGAGGLAAPSGSCRCWLACSSCVPWLKQWHNELDPELGVRMGDYFEDFVDEEARALGLTLETDPRLDASQEDARRRSTRKKAARKQQD